MTDPYEIHDLATDDSDLSSISIGLHQKDILHIYDEQDNALLVHVDTVEELVEELLESKSRAQASSQAVEALEDE